MSNDWALPVRTDSSRSGRTKMTGMIARGMKTSVGLSLSLVRFPFAGRQSNIPTQRVLPPIGVILWAVDRCGLAIRKADVHPFGKSAACGILLLDWHLQARKLGDGVLRHRKIFVINLKPNVYRWLIESTGQTRGGGDAS